MVFGPITKVALYAHVNTTDKGQDLEMQLHELRDYARQKKWKVEAEYVDTGVSGLKHSRPQLDELMKAAHRGKFDGVCVWKLDRFTRSMNHLFHALETFKTTGVEFCSYSEQLDTSTPAGKKFFTALGAMADLEASLIVDTSRRVARRGRGST